MAMCGMPKWVAIREAWVPFPAPGAAIITIRMIGLLSLVRTVAVLLHESCCGRRFGAWVR
ncbi:hypothetical protein GCM10022255_090360 [Dactylosporangium darangshiense]|uniref:Uncharacterized protein n=1 Tax=Dactylosporangium darangshiense TaxID=579108 RepID=A0ABP8DNW5_9ACTN